MKQLKTLLEVYKSLLKSFSSTKKLCFDKSYMTLNNEAFLPLKSAQKGV